MTPNAQRFDEWIRTRFRALNTELEEAYFAQDDRASVKGVRDDLKAALRDEGDAHIQALLAEGNTDDGFDAAFALLGDVGFYLGAMRRHELTNPAREKTSPFRAASALAMHIAASLGLAPRFATSHLATHNKAVAGVYKSFTALADEKLFIDYNAYGIFGYMRAADALRRIVPLGVSNPIAKFLFDDAADALDGVARHNDALFDRLDADRFFYCVRPYYKTYRVGRAEYRGANAGDFAGINEIDLLTGLCRANDPSYSQLLVDKMLFMTPADQAQLREALRRESFLDGFLDLVDAHAGADWFVANARAFLRVCDRFGRTASQHHDALVKRFIEETAARDALTEREGLTASGPPLPVLVDALEKLRDRRVAAPRDDVPTRAADMARLRAAVGG
ncbi:MAG: monodechloroaminopyrrolnitrin synthase PrnB family protein [Pseudomonadota bacterium]